MGRRKWRQYQKLVLSSQDDLSMEAKDWEPADKCNLCLDQGDDTPLPPRPPSAESASSTSVEDSADQYPAMTTLETVASSMAASLAAVAALSHAKPPATLYPPPGLFPWYLGPEPPKPSPPVPEQPLDLSKTSSKSPPPEPPPLVDTPPSLQHLVPSPSLKVPAALNRLYKAKPRLSAVAGRRTYTEDELQAALRDIQSGKLGTRRAAVIYGIPRSTLRNKVYKLAMERERDSHLVLSASPDDVAKARALLGDKDDDDQDDDDDKDSGAEEEREVEKALMRPIISIEDFMRLSSESGVFPGTDSLRTLLQHGSKYLGDRKEDGSSSPPVFPAVFPTPGSADMWNGMDHAALGPYINRLLSANPLGQPSPFVMAGNRNSPTERSPTDSPGDFVPKLSHIELVRRMMIEERLLQEEQQKKERNLLNGARLGEPGPSSSVIQEDETSGSGTPPNVILRIPSFKPTSKNGMPGEPPGFPLGVKIGESSQHSVISPPISIGRSESSSPPSVGKGISVSLRDVIAKSISQKFQQPTDLHHLPHTPPGLEHFRRADFSQPLGCSPPIMRNHNNNHLDERKMHIPTSNKPPTSGTNTSSSSGGKGTRPKRGKYRNYDRDSLVEAVRAVQRGEMSVHRAGSYYGVPHSTLEYKVKERHLMRPRKREPKSVQEEIKLKEEPTTTRIPPPVQLDKGKLLPPTKPPKTPFPPSAPLPPGPNGLKMPPMFDPSLPYGAAPPFPFWPPNPFPHLPMDYPRNPTFPPTPDHFFASQMIQRLQEDSSRTPHSPPPTLGKTARELAETLYDGTGTNGSFLDGIIRSSLESGLPVKTKDGEMKRPEHMSNKALLDQLCRNSRMTPVPKADASSSDDETSKRALNQKRPCEDTPAEVQQDVPEDTDRSPKPEVKTEPVAEVNTDDSKLKTDNVDESACDSNHTIKRAKLEEET